MGRFRFALPAVLAAVVSTAGCGHGAATLSPVAAPSPVASAPAEATGRLEVRVSGLGEPARATYLRVTVSGAGLRAPRAKEVMAQSTGALALESIPVGPVMVTIEALDADGARVGLQTAAATVLKGQTAVASADLALKAPRDVGYGDPGAASPAPEPAEQAAEAPIAGEPLVSWYADGTMGVEGVVTNPAGVARALRVRAAFSGRGLVGWKTVETAVVELGVVEPHGSRTFSIRSGQKVSGLLADGRVAVTVSAE